MKNKPNHDILILQNVKKILLTMKIFLFLILFSAVSLQAGSVFSQNKKMTVDMQNVTVREVINEIEKQGGISFLFNDNLQELNRQVFVSHVDQPIQDVLYSALDQANLTFEEVGENFIVLLPNPESIKQQEITVTGRVVDAGTGEPLPGVTVMLRGTTIGVITDIDGNYSMSNVPPNSVLVFSFVGMRTREVQVDDRTVINVELDAEAVFLEEVVAIGYGTRLREELTGAVSTVSSAQLQSSTNSNVIGRLQGQVSGVTVSNSNLPGGGSVIRVRGIGTINAPEPLYVIDGVPTGPGTSINPNDIESISVLKDASSAAIYGTRGANGVIIIETKRGMRDTAPSVSFNATRGFSRPDHLYDLLNTQEHAEMEWLIFQNRGVAPSHPQYGSGATPRIPDYIRPAGTMEGDPAVDPSNYSYPDNLITRANKEGTDWLEEISQTGVRDEYDISIRGGTQDVTYSASAGYMNEEGMFIHTGFDRYTFRNTVDATLSDRFSVGQTLNISRTENKGQRTDNTEMGPVYRASTNLPIIPRYDIMGNFAGNQAAGLGAGDETSYAHLHRNRNQRGRTARIMGNVFGDFALTEGLVFRSLLGYNYSNGNSRSYRMTNPEALLYFTAATYNQGSSEAFQWNWANTLQYNRTIADNHRIEALVGTESIESRFESLSGSRTGYFSEDVNFMRLGSGESDITNDGSGWEWSLFSVFGRVNYSILGGRYIFEATVRHDGSSRFSRENRFATFPAFSGAWVISSEPFMAGSQNWLNFLKLRTGWGMSGNDNIGNYNIYTTFGARAARLNLSTYPITGSNTDHFSGFMPLAFGNPYVTWETTTTLNLGIDASLLDNTVNLGIDIWERNTDDMLYPVGVPAVAGVGSHPFVNIGSMRNRGFDFELGYTNTAVAGRLRYSANLVLSRYVNEITKLSDNVEEEIVAGSNRQIFYLRATKGTAFPEFYGYIADGFFESAEEAAAHPTAFGEGGAYNAPGRVKYRDISGPDGVPDGIIDDNDMTYIGSPHPDLTGGLNLELGYGNFNFNVFAYGSYGNDIIHYARRQMEYSLHGGNSHVNRLYKSWGSPYLNGDNSKATVAIADNNTGSEQPSTLFIEDGSYLRIRSLMLSYDLPGSITSRINVQGIRIHAQVTNPLTFTSYTGLDPDLTAAGYGMGIDRGGWATLRQLIFGISMNL